MIPHNYINASDDIVQFQADLVERQEVTADYYLENMAERPVWAWVSTEAFEMGMDPWRLNPEVDEAEARGWRLFVQRRDIH